ncbi:hypothetical protein KY331_04480, partial [Candidatus Woesearchaeota archaeon]|nr:hypothetical protein [Candidatus Woesearchaeota archaeon]
TQDRSFDGLIDEVAIFDRALTESEIQDIYNNGGHCDIPIPTPTCTDSDGDGYAVEVGECGLVDCDDNNAAVNPGATEVCDGIDNNCDTQIDENNGDCLAPTPYCVAGTCVECLTNAECDDGLYCNGAEVCSVGTCQAGTPIVCNDGLACTTDSCNEETDGCDYTPIDLDEDNYNICEGPNKDCNDNDVNINPGATEVCDNVDNNCNGQIDEGFDVDDDGYKTCQNDCDDTNADINPGATEICDGVDNNCDDAVDYVIDLGDLDDSCGIDSCEGTDTYFNYYCDEGVGCATEQVIQDNDNDGFNGLCTDCNDNYDAIYPGAQEVCPDDGIDNNCDGQATFDCDAVCDKDGDTWWDDSIWYCVGANDCDDTNANINPAAEEICDGIDNNCDDNYGNYDNDPNTGIDNRDEDNDDVNDCTTDKCFNTILPETAVPSMYLKPNNYAETDGDNIFEVNIGSKTAPNIVDSSYLLTSTYGCSCEQILECKPGKNSGEYKFGCTEGTFGIWITQDDWAQGCQGLTSWGTLVVKAGEAKSATEDTDGDGIPDTEDTDDDGDGIPDTEDSEPESKPDPATGKPKGKPDWWCNNHPGEC